MAPFTCSISADKVCASFKQSMPSLPKCFANRKPDKDPSPAPVQSTTSIFGACNDTDLSRVYNAEPCIPLCNHICSMPLFNNSSTCCCVKNASDEHKAGSSSSFGVIR